MSSVSVVLRIRDYPNDTVDDSIFTLGRKNAINTTTTKSKIITIEDPTDKDKALREFMFDKIFDKKTTQDVLYYETARPLLDKVFQGFNACCFAYGQTGSGKTHSIFGQNGKSHGHYRGILPRCIEEIFERIKQMEAQAEFKVFVSFMEIYLDHVGDLGKCSLDQQAGKKLPKRNYSENYPWESLDIRETNDGKVYVDGLSQIPVSKKEEVMKVVEVGVNNRATFETTMNEYSSRSHTVFSIKIFQKSKNPNVDPDMSIIQGTLNLIDLAGSERLKKSNSSEQRLKEAVNINSSLSALGNVILGLYNQSPHIPYRDSKLTRILQDYLGGNSFTTLIGTLNPRVGNYEESLATLQFAFRCKNVRNQPTINYVDTNMASKDRRIRQLEAEVARLKRELAEVRRGFGQEGEEDHETKTKHRRLGRRGSQQAYDSSLLPSNLPSDAGTSEIERFKAEKKYATAVKEKQKLKNQMKEHTETISKLQSNLENEERKFTTQLHDIRKKQTEAEKKLKTEKVKLKQILVEKEKESENKMKQVVEMYEKQIAELSEMFNAVPKSLRSKHDQLKQLEEKLNKSESDFSKSLSNKLNSLAEDKDRTLEQTRNQYEILLRKKEVEIGEVRQSYTMLQETKEKEVKSLQKQVDVLYEYVSKLSYIMHKLETGQYPVQMKFQTAHMQIPLKDKPQPLSDSLVPYIREKLVEVNQFIHEGEIYADTQVQGKSTGKSFSLDRKSVKSFNKLRRPPTGKSASTRFSNSVYMFPTTPYSTKKRPQSAASTFLSTRREKIVQKAQTLEGDDSRYKALFLQEQAQHQEIRIAYNALKRKFEKENTQRRPSSCRDAKRRPTSGRDGTFITTGESTFSTRSSVGKPSDVVKKQALSYRRG